MMLRLLIPPLVFVALIGALLWLACKSPVENHYPDDGSLRGNHHDSE